ncbi:MAG: hypothetical protein KF760_29265 [Candidatus Eremiobacteraeota bacterium]|nr:hypothetical protein [Candidatus Eremiobacteraeota bacterium]MCW5865936.1 hypothetical protein [Candidatus Eremiobacteraeota bacterium]
MSKVSQQLSLTRTYQKPVRQKKHLGSVPGDYYEGRHLIPQHGLGSLKHYPGNEAGPRKIERYVPVYNADGTPKMEIVTETLCAKTYQPKGRGAGCGLLGGATAGAVAGTLAAGPIGTVLGTLVGAAAGGAIGFHSAKNDQLSERWVERPIDHPGMNGYNEYTVPVPEFHRHQDENGQKKTDVSLKGYYHHFGPVLEHKTVGTYQEPEIAHSRPGPLKAGLLTVGAGLAVGLLAVLFGRED